MRAIISNRCYLSAADSDSTGLPGDHMCYTECEAGHTQVTVQSDESSKRKRKKKKTTNQ